MNTIQEVVSQQTALIPAVVCFPVRGTEVLLIHRIKEGGLGEGLVSGIGGKVGDEKAFENETYEQALVREVKEETGIVPTEYRNAGRVRFLWVERPTWSMDVQIYLVDAWKGEPVQTEAARPVWHKIDNLPTENMWPDNPHWVPRVLFGEIIDAVFLYGPDKQLAEWIFN